MVYPKAPSDEDKDDEEVWEVDPRFKAECRLIGIKLRHRVLLDFLRGAEWLPLVQPSSGILTAVEAPDVAHFLTEPAPASKAPLTDKESLKQWLPGAVERWPRDKVDTDDYPEFLRRKAPKEWTKHYIQTALSALAKEKRSKKS